MSATKKKARAELALREWVEIEVSLSSQGQIDDVVWNVWGCHKLIEATSRAALQMKSKPLADVKWKGAAHHDLLIREVVEKLQDRFELPLAGEELCHCRKVPTAKVDEAVVLGAHTPEKVRAWTTASSSCGTCRPDVEKIISFRLKKP